MIDAFVTPNLVLPQNQLAKYSVKTVTISPLVIWVNSIYQELK